jgi:hypothetical protein
LVITIKRIDNIIINQGIPLASFSDCHGIAIPRESAKSNHILAIYWPLMHPMGLPVLNEAWTLKASFYLQCYYGDWVVIKESRPFVIMGDWQAAKVQLSQIKNLFGTGGT